MSKERAAQLVEAGIWLKLSGDLEGARKLFERALALDPENERVRELVGESPKPPEAPPPQTAVNPFERPEAALSVDSDWGRATGFGPLSPPNAGAPSTAAAAPKADLADDWGTLTSGESESVPPSVAAMNAAGMTVTLSGAASPEVDRSTPPLFNGQAPVSSAPDPTAGINIVIGGSAGSAQPSRSTPPLFEDSQAPVASTKRSSGSGVRSSGSGVRDVAPPPAPAELFKDAPPDAPSFDSAWTWDAKTDHRLSSFAVTAPEAPAPQEPVADPPPPLPPPSAPNLAPFAESAWDAQSNPGIKLSGAPGASALELVEPVRVSSPSSPNGRRDEVQTLLRGARDLLDLDDHTGAMELILKAQEAAPDDAEVVSLRERSERTLLAMFESKIGSLAAIPRVMLKDDEIIWLNLDHRAGFVLAQIDGSVTFDDLFAVSGMSRLDTARIIAQLIDEGVISRG